MIDIITLILFVALSINVPIMLAYLKGINFQINNFNCPNEVNEVKNNIRLTKIIQVFNVVILLALIIMINL
jgi:hypothetical protein